ncbi:MAG: PIG-L family deacetylase, partial [Candidatus Omnitrophota bacterium]
MNSSNSPALTRYVFFLCVFHLCVLSSRAWAQSALPEFNKDDRVLVLAPHPDDECIATAGVIQRALGSGAKVKVVCYTNGDNNEFAFIVYEKRLTFRKSEFLHMGAVRGKETMAAMNFLGVGEQDVNYMGYPDFGTMEILTKYWDTQRPFRSMLPRVQKVSYQNAMSVGAPFTGESILRDMKTILMAFKPTKIFVSHPSDTNRDHQSLYLFLHVALWDLDGSFVRPQVFPYLVHVIGWPVPRGKHRY